MAEPQAEPAPLASEKKLSPTDYKVYNSMAEHMDYFHSHFRSTWKMLYGACSSGKRPVGMTIKQFIGAGEQFCHHLTAHHSIEEMHIFPLLATRMPAFKKELQLLTQHKQIHAGLDRFEEYLAQCKRGETDFRMEELKSLMDTFGDVLWTHLDDEVKELGAENMRKYWSVAEMQRMPM